MIRKQSKNEIVRDDTVLVILPTGLYGKEDARNKYNHAKTAGKTVTAVFVYERSPMQYQHAMEVFDNVIAAGARLK